MHARGATARSRGARWRLAPPILRKCGSTTPWQRDRGQVHPHFPRGRAVSIALEPCRHIGRIAHGRFTQHRHRPHFRRIRRKGTRPLRARTATSATRSTAFATRGLSTRRTHLGHICKFLRKRRGLASDIHGLVRGILSSLPVRRRHATRRLWQGCSLGNLRSWRSLTDLLSQTVDFPLEASLATGVTVSGLAELLPELLALLLQQLILGLRLIPQNRTVANSGVALGSTSTMRKNSAFSCPPLSTAHGAAAREL